MEHVNQIIQHVKNGSGPKSSGTSWTPAQEQIIDWFYMRLMNIYGSKFDAQFTSEPEILASKVEWGRQILSCGKRYVSEGIGRRAVFDEDMAREKLHKILSTVKSAMQPDDWPNIGAILNTPTGHSPDGKNAAAYLPHQPNQALPDQSKETRRKDVGRRELDKMKAMLY